MEMTGQICKSVCTKMQDPGDSRPPTVLPAGAHVSWFFVCLFVCLLAYLFCFFFFNFCFLCNHCKILEQFKTKGKRMGIFVLMTLIFLTS